MSPELSDDDLLFEGFNRIQPAAEASARAIERTRQALLRGAPRITMPRSTSDTWARSVASVVGVAAMFGIICVLIGLRKDRPGDRDVARSPHLETGGENPLPVAAKWVSSIQTLVATDRPILVANGSAQPIHLGASVATQDVGSALHVWDWSRSPFSRIVPGVEFSASSHAAISPDGRYLVFAGGQIVDLESGDQSTIDLGGESYEINGAIYGRIGGMKFSPDGRRLALFETTFDDDRPGLIKGEVIQVVDFPSGEFVCEFPAGSSRMDSIVFSADNAELVSLSTEKQVVRRQVATASVTREYEPVLESSILSVALSPDDRLMATSLVNGDLFIWSVESKQIVRRIDFAQFRDRGGAVVFGGLRFAPDSRYLAAEYWDRVFVVDASTGTISSEFRDRIFRQFQWSRDKKVLTGVTPVSEGRSPDAGRFEVYPEIHEWDWRKGRHLRSLHQSDPGK